MSEAKAHGNSLTPPAPPEEFDLHVQTVQNDLSALEEHGSKADCAHGIELLEALISAARCKQAGLAHQIEKEYVRDHEERGVHLDDQTRGAAACVALARKQSPHGMRNYLVNCRILFEDTPNLAAACARGEFTEAQTQAILTPLQNLKPQRRTEFDHLYAQNPHMFESMGTTQIKETVRKFALAYISDPDSIKQKTVEEQRNLTLKIDDQHGRIIIHGEYPLLQGMCLKRYLDEESKTLRKKGDPRTRTQIRADLLFSYMMVGEPSKMPIALQVAVVMTDRALFAGEREPAYLEGYGFIPAQSVREWISGHQIPNSLTFDQMDAKPTTELIEQLDVRTELARLYTAPGDQDLIAMDSKARIFPEKLKKFIAIRDRHCRTPFCDGIVEEIDHVKQYARGGKSTVFNGDGRCASCNKAKEAAGWYEYTTYGNGHTIMICPGSAMSYKSTAPPATGYAHKPFPQLRRDSKWIQQLKERLKPKDGPEDLAA
ncbi:HNH endonuclease [Glutamicibacter sp. AGC13]